MNREVVKKLALSQQVTQEELNTFIVDYVKDQKGIDLHPKELSGILQAIAMHVFNLSDAILISCKKLNIQVCQVLDNTGMPIKNFIYDT